MKNDYSLCSPQYNEHVPYWIGATDIHFEGDFRWTDGLPFSFSSKTFVNSTVYLLTRLIRNSSLQLSIAFCAEWFPGWQHPKNYNRQPNDDGLSKQDCVEIRRHFLRPDSSTEFLTDSFMWNDRGCSTRNFFLCERPLIDGKFHPA